MKMTEWRASGKRGSVRCAWTVVALLVLMGALSGCARYLMPTPRIYSSGDQQAFGPLDPALQSNRVDILYVTDRQSKSDDPDNPRYGYGRSPSVAFGSAIVALGKYETWEDLFVYSNRATRPGERPRLELLETTELGRLPATPYRFQMVEGTGIELDAGVVAERDEAIAALRSELRKRLALTPRKEVFLFVHGVGNKFNDAVETAAQLWHFLGREGVPIAYTWPAGRGGLFFYNYDRESSEFTIFHLKQFAKLLGSTPEVEKVHVISHSRGTDVTLTAMRELVIEARAANANPRDLFKTENVVLIAPDLDFEVTMQRDVSEGLGAAFGRMTVYASQEDQALGAAQMLFGSRVRLGSTRPEDLTDEQRETLRRQHQLDIVVYQGRIGGAFGHGYAVDNPAVSSDVVALLRFGWSPGQENGRPLKPLGENFWLITDDYMRPRASPR